MPKKYSNNSVTISGPKGLTRRRFCCLAAGAVPVSAFLAACHGAEDETPVDRSFVLCPISKIRTGQNRFDLESLLLIKDEAGIGAMTMTCTHQRCALKIENGIDGQAPIVCPCHGSLFTERGDVLKGPATEPLPWFEVSIDAQGMVVVNLAKRVNPEWRLKV
jgi:nitrite reductase/ring-hydroxylating ferredoxin subunit